jgi:nitrogen fixation NifU-like protein
MMTQMVKGKTKAEAVQLFEKFHGLVTGKDEAAKAAGKDQVADLGKMAVFSGVSKFPARVKCATLAWHTLQSALEEEKKPEPVSTE